jgi:hypothetical protein
MSNLLAALHQAGGYMVAFQAVLSCSNFPGSPEKRSGPSPAAVMEVFSPSGINPYLLGVDTNEEIALFVNDALALIDGAFIARAKVLHRYIDKPQPANGAADAGAEFLQIRERR